MRISTFTDFVPWKISKLQKDVKSGLEQGIERIDLNLRNNLAMLGFVVNILWQVLNQMILFIQIMFPQYLLLSLWLVPQGRGKVLTDMKDLKNMLETRTKKIKKRLSQQEWKNTFCRCRDEHSVPDCVEKI